MASGITMSDVENGDLFPFFSWLVWEQKDIQIFICYLLFDFTQKEYFTVQVKTRPEIVHQLRMAHTHHRH